MSWHYQMRKRIIDDEEIYDIVEIYDQDNVWTMDGIAPIGNTKEELIQDLERMISDANKYPILEDIIWI